MNIYATISGASMTSFTLNYIFYSSIINLTKNFFKYWFKGLCIPSSKLALARVRNTSLAHYVCICHCFPFDCVRKHVPVIKHCAITDESSNECLSQSPTRLGPSVSSIDSALALRRGGANTKK